MGGPSPVPAPGLSHPFQGVRGAVTREALARLVGSALTPPLGFLLFGIRASIGLLCLPFIGLPAVYVLEVQLLFLEYSCSPCQVFKKTLGSPVVLNTFYMKRPSVWKF